MFGPLAFIIFNNDLDGKTFLILIMNKFAEDTKLGHKVNIDADKQVLQKVATWENTLEKLPFWKVSKIYLSTVWSMLRTQENQDCMYKMPYFSH